MGGDGSRSGRPTNPISCGVSTGLTSVSGTRIGRRTFGVRTEQSSRWIVLLGTIGRFWGRYGSSGCATDRRHHTRMGLGFTLCQQFQRWETIGMGQFFTTGRSSSIATRESIGASVASAPVRVRCIDPRTTAGKRAGRRVPLDLAAN